MTCYDLWFMSSIRLVFIFYSSCTTYDVFDLVRNQTFLTHRTLIDISHVNNIISPTLNGQQIIICIGPFIFILFIFQTPCTCAHVHMTQKSHFYPRSSFQIFQSWKFSLSSSFFRIKGSAAQPKRTPRFGSECGFFSRQWSNFGLYLLIGLNTETRLAVDDSWILMRFCFSSLNLKCSKLVRRYSGWSGRWSKTEIIWI